MQNKQIPINTSQNYEGHMLLSFVSEASKFYMTTQNLKNLFSVVDIFTDCTDAKWRKIT